MADEKKPEEKKADNKNKVVMKDNVRFNGRKLPKGSVCPADCAEAMLKQGLAHHV